jgi:type IV pilus assembly protein PilC
MAQTFVYKVRDRMGKNHTGKVEADSKEALVEKLRESGYVVTKVEAKVTQMTVGETFARWAVVNAQDLSIFCRQFATMVGAGLPLMKCLNILVEQTSKIGLREALEDVRREIEAGTALSSAMNKHTDIFPTIMVAMVRAGETGGILDETLERLAEHFESEYELREKVKTATRYPIIVLGIAVIVIIVMMAFVLPTFEKMLSGMGVELPLPTKILMAASGFTQKYFVLIIVFMALGIYGIVRYIRSPEGKRRFDALLLKLPVVSNIVRKIATARLCRTLGTLVHSGVPILQAIEVSEATAGNSVIAEGLAKAKDSIREGEGIARPLEATGVFSPMVTQMIAVGEETGNLDVMLKKVADFYEKEVKHIVDNLSTLIEPILVVFLGVVIGSMIISILLPMLKVYESVGSY